MPRFSREQAAEYARMAAQFYHRAREYERCNNREQARHHFSMADYYWEMADR